MATEKTKESEQNVASDAVKKAEKNKIEVNWAAVAGVVGVLGLGAAHLYQTREEEHLVPERLEAEQAEKHRARGEELQSFQYNKELALQGLLRNFKDIPSLHACPDYVPRPEFETVVKGYFGVPGHFLVVFGHKDGGKSTLVHKVACKHGNGTDGVCGCLSLLMCSLRVLNRVLTSSP